LKACEEVVGEYVESGTLRLKLKLKLRAITGVRSREMHSETDSRFSIVGSSTKGVNA